MYILVPASLCHLFAPIFCSDEENTLFGAICDKFATYLVQIYHYDWNIYAEIAPSKIGIQDEFNK